VGMVAEPAGAGPVGPAGAAGQQGDAALLDAAAVAGSVGMVGHGEPQERHGADAVTDLAFDLVFQIGPLGAPGGAHPGLKQPVGPVTGADQRRADMRAEDRRPVVAATGVAATAPPPVLAQPGPHGRLAGRGQRVGADAHYPWAAVGAVFTVFVEE